MHKKKLSEEHFIRYKIYDQKKSLFRKYAELTTGEISIVGSLKYELITSFCGGLPGAAGFFLRKFFYKKLVNQKDNKVIWGRNITLRYPSKIHIGRKVVIDDYVLIDARGSGNAGVTIGDNVIINRGTIIQSKVGPIYIGSETNIGAGTVISAQGGVIIGDLVNIAGGCNIAGGAYDVVRDETSVREHGKYTSGPIRIDNKCRLGRCAMVLDGAHISEGTIIGAMSMVKDELPPYCVAAGIPAKVLYKRSDVSS